MKHSKLEDAQFEYLHRTARFLAEMPWGAEYYRAQMAGIAEIERLRAENALLLRLVSTERRPDPSDPLRSLVRLVESV